MKKIALFGTLLSIFCTVNHLEANDTMNALNTKEQKIVAIAAIQYLPSLFMIDFPSMLGFVKLFL